MVTPSAVVRLIERALAPIRRRVSLLVTRALVSLIDDAGKVQLVQVKLLAGEVVDNVEHVQPYGLTSNAPSDSEAVFLSVGGARSAGVVICVGNREFRLKGLAAGEVALYSKFDNFVKLKADGSIEVVATEIRLGSSDAATEAARNGDSVSVEIPANSVVVGVTGGSGAPAVGIMNPAPITLTGTITEGAPNVKIGGA